MVKKEPGRWPPSPHRRPLAHFEVNTIIIGQMCHQSWHFHMFTLNKLIRWRPVCHSTGELGSPCFYPKGGKQRHQTPASYIHSDKNYLREWMEKVKLTTLWPIPSSRCWDILTNWKLSPAVGAKVTEPLILWRPRRSAPTFRIIYPIVAKTWSSR